MDKPQFTANDAHKYMTNINVEQATQWSRVANLKFNNYVKKFKKTSPLILRERAASETCVEMLGQWKSL